MRALLCLLALLSTVPAWAQDTTCDNGDIAWVSSGVNANVGTGLGAGRCTTNTVAGAAYNDPSMPWGIQAALDCACNGLEIRVRGDTGDYGSATSSWNNRFDATKEIRSTFNAIEDTPVNIIGYVNAATSCRTIDADASCPVEMNFGGGTSVGWRLDAAGHAIRGLRVHSAASDGVLVTANGDFNALGESEIDANGAWGVNNNSGDGFVVVRVSIHDNPSGGALLDPHQVTNRQASIWYSDIYDNGTGVGDPGLEWRAGDQPITAFNVIQNNTGCGMEQNGVGHMIVHNTFRDNAVDGICDSGIAGAKFQTSVINNIFADNGGWGINGASVVAQLVGNICDNNPSGCFNLTATVSGPEPPLDRDNQTSGSVVFTSATNSLPVAGADLSYTYGRGGLVINFFAGAVQDDSMNIGMGGGGVFIPGGAR